MTRLLGMCKRSSHWGPRWRWFAAVALVLAALEVFGLASSILQNNWRPLQRKRPREVHLRHVRSHVKTVGNEIADWLADCGSRMADVTTRATIDWTRKWINAELAPRPAQVRQAGHQLPPPDDDKDHG